MSIGINVKSVSAPTSHCILRYDSQNLTFSNKSLIKIMDSTKPIHLSYNLTRDACPETVVTTDANTLFSICREVLNPSMQALRNLIGFDFKKP